MGNWRTDWPTDQWTDGPSYRDARTHLKTVESRPELLAAVSQTCISGWMPSFPTPHFAHWSTVSLAIGRRPSFTSSVSKLISWFISRRTTRIWVETAYLSLSRPALGGSRYKFKISKTTTTTTTTITTMTTTKTTTKMKIQKIKQNRRWFQKKMFRRGKQIIFGDSSSVCWSFRTPRWSCFVPKRIIFIADYKLFMFFHFFMHVLPL